MYYVCFGPLVGLATFMLFLYLTHSAMLKIVALGFLFGGMSVIAAYMLGIVPSLLAGLYAAFFRMPNNLKPIYYLLYLLVPIIGSASIIALVCKCYRRFSCPDSCSADIALFFMLTSVISALILYLFLSKKIHTTNTTPST